MSRIGKRPIELPKGVTVNVNGGFFEVKGPKGTIKRPFPSSVTWSLDNGAGVVGMKSDAPADIANREHGTTRALIASAVKGVSDGYAKKLLLLGTGYKAEVKGQLLTLSLGLSHLVKFEVPKEIKIGKIDPKGQATVNDKTESGTTIELESFDKEVLGQAIADIQGHRPPEPYKGKGVNIDGTHVRRKAGKAGAKGGK